MKQGAIAVLDTLGFKGVWKRLEPGVVFGKLRHLRDTVVQDVVRANASFPTMMGADAITRHAKFFSDTAVVAASIEPGGGPFPPFPETPGDMFFGGVRQDHALRDILIALAKFLHVAATQPPPFAYRGCISCGAFAIEDDFLLGPAVDEAAELADLPDGAFVIIAPHDASALTALQGGGPYIELFDALAPSLSSSDERGPRHRVPRSKSTYSD